jgi:hypothetical protein
LPERIRNVVQTIQDRGVRFIDGGWRDPEVHKRGRERSATTSKSDVTPDAVAAPATEDTFHWISTILSMVLGLSATRLLGGFAAFRARKWAPLDWIPISWLAVVFLAMVQFWWAVRHIPTVHALGFWTYLLLVSLILLLFSSAGLLLPFGEGGEDGSLRAFFEENGRYALMAFFRLSLGWLCYEHLGFRLSCVQH